VVVGPRREPVDNAVVRYASITHVRVHFSGTNGHRLGKSRSHEPLDQEIGKLMTDSIREGFMVFVSDGDQGVGAVRQIRSNEFVLFVENAGDFIVPFTAVKSVHSGKAMIDGAKLDRRLRVAIGHAHDLEDR
jgi:hypothetical protein